MLISGAKETIHAKNNAQYLDTLKKFIEKYGYFPRQSIVAKEASMTEEERLDEASLGRWGRSVFDRTTNNKNVQWQYPDKQKAEFNKLWKETPTYDQKKNTDNFNAWRKFIKEKGYIPRSEIKKDTTITEEEKLYELKLGHWNKKIVQVAKANYDWKNQWQHQVQQLMFDKLMKYTPTYDQKKNTDRFNAWKKFIDENGYVPRYEIVKNKNITEADRLEEIILGHWWQSVYQNIKGNTGYATKWQYPYEQKNEFNKLLNDTPTYDQKKNTDNFNAWRKFIKEKGHIPRRLKIENVDVTDDMLVELNLATWFENTSANENGRTGFATEWQYRLQRLFFNKLMQETPTYKQKNNMDRLIEFMKFCLRNHHKPRRDKNTGNDLISPEEHKLAEWIYYTANRKNANWQYSWQQTVFDEFFSKTKTWREYMKDDSHEDQAKFVAKYNLQDLYQYMKDHNIPLI